jgi:hypothetical protein
MTVKKPRACPGCQAEKLDHFPVRQLRLGMISFANAVWMAVGLVLVGALGVWLLGSGRSTGEHRNAAEPASRVGTLQLESMAQLSQTPVPPLGHTEIPPVRPDDQRWLPRLKSLEGGSRTPKQLFHDFYQGRQQELGDFPPGFELGENDRWTGYLGDPDKCLVELRNSLVGFLQDTSKGRLSVKILGAKVSLDTQGMVTEMLRTLDRGGDYSPTGEVDRSSAAYQALLAYLDSEVRGLVDLSSQLRRAKEEAVRQDVAGLDAWTLPTRGHLHFGPVHVLNEFRPEIMLRLKQPYDLWSDCVPFLGNQVSVECRAYVAVYLVDWQDFPEIAAKIEQFLASAQSLEPVLESMLLALPRL